MDFKKLGFGLMRLPYCDDESRGNIDYEKTKAMIDSYMAQGFSYFDTAWVYHGGHSEEAFGELVADCYPREKFQVVTKMPLWDVKEEKDLQTIFDKQLEKCHVKYFDFYFLHALDKEKVKLAEKFHAFEFVSKMKGQGKIKHIGFSFHDSADVLDDILTKHPEMELIQLQINYIDWESDDVQSRKCYEIAAVKHNKMIAVMEPLKGGNLATLTPNALEILKNENPTLSTASWGIRYAASLKNVIIVLSGMSNMEQLEDNMSYMKDFVPLNESEKAAIEKTAEIVKSTIAIPCTACRYCTDGCPAKISIPDYFKLFNQSKQFTLTSSLKWNYSETKKKGGALSDCVECGQCETHCPQKIKIIESLKEVSKEFEK